MDQKQSRAINTSDLVELFAAVRNQEWIVRAIMVAVLTIVSLVPLLPLLSHGAYPETHERLRYAVLTEHFRAAIQNGVWYPRWLPDIAGGYGYPTFVFYQPLFFYLASTVAMTTGLSVAVACWVAIGIASFLGACGVYLLGRMRGSRPFSVLAALLFLVTPYLFVDIYVRGDLSEAFAMLLTPWPIYFALKIQVRVNAGLPATVPAVALAVGIAAIVMSHPATAVAFFGCLLLFTGGIYFDITNREHRAVFLKVFCFATLLGLTISVPYWETVFEMRRYVNFQRLTAESLTGSGHVVYLKQLVSNYWNFGASSPTGDHDEMSFQLGAVHLVIALAGLYADRRNLKIRATFICYAILILLMLPWSRLLWDVVPLLRIMQFPWRLLSVIGIFQVCAVLGLARAGRPSRFSAVIVAMALLAFLGVNRKQFKIHPGTPETFKWGKLDQTIADVFNADSGSINTYASANEFLPKTAQMPLEHRALPLVEISHGTAQPLSDSNSFKLDYQLDADLPTSVLIRQFYLPGWRVDLDDTTLSREALESALTPAGLMTVNVPSPGRHTMRAWYEGPPWWPARNGIAALTSLALTIILVRLARRLPLQTAISG